MPLKSWPELDAAPEDAFVNRAIGRAVVREADAARTPVAAEQVLQSSKRDADRKLGRLAHGTAVPDHQELAQDDDVGGLLDGQVQRIVQSPAVLDERLQRRRGVGCSRMRRPSGRGSTAAASPP
jgi:hypothetical protein